MMGLITVPPLITISSLLVCGQIKSQLRPVSKLRNVKTKRNLDCGIVGAGPAAAVVGWLLLPAAQLALGGQLLTLSARGPRVWESIITSYHFTFIWSIFLLDPSKVGSAAHADVQPEGRQCERVGSYYFPIFLLSSHSQVDQVWSAAAVAQLKGRYFQSVLQVFTFIFQGWP